MTPDGAGEAAAARLRLTVGIQQGAVESARARADPRRPQVVGAGAGKAHLGQRGGERVGLAGLPLGAEHDRRQLGQSQRACLSVRLASAQAKGAVAELAQAGRTARLRGAQLFQAGSALVDGDARVDLEAGAVAGDKVCPPAAPF